jgi:uncharacterized protein
VRDDPLNYDRLMEEAMRSVVRRSVAVAAERGLPGQHHFYVTFRTDLPGVALPDVLRARYPREMTIVLQHQFWGLDVREESFSVTLSFDSKHERLTIPFAAVSAFVDPSVQFGLQFPNTANAQGATTTAASAALPAAAKPAAPRESAAEAKPADDAAKPKPAEGQVIALDAFRKK